MTSPDLPTGPTIATRLAATLQEAGIACKSCGGYGATVVREDYRYERCPECGGDGIAPEHKQDYRDPALVCDACGNTMDTSGQEIVCPTCSRISQVDAS